MLRVKEIMDQLGNIRSQHAFPSMDSGLDEGDNTKARRSVVVHQSSTIGGRAHMQDLPVRIHEADSRRAALTPSILKFYLEIQLVLPRVRIERPKGACDVDGFMVCGREIGSLNPVR